MNYMVSVMTKIRFNQAKRKETKKSYVMTVWIKKKVGKQGDI